MTDTANKSSATPSAALVFVVLVWGLGPPIAKLITAPSVVSVLYRFALSVPLLYVFAALRGHRPTQVSVRKSAWAGAAFGINLLFVFLTINQGAVAVLSVIAALQPGVILLVAGRFLGERPTLWHIIWTMVGIVGTAVVVVGGGDGFEVDVLGVLYAVIAMVFFTVYFLITKQVRSANDIDSVQWMAGIVFWAAVAVAPWALISNSRAEFAELAGIDWLWLAAMIVFTGGLGHIVMAWVHRYIDASRSSLYLLSMHVVAIAAAWLIHDEPLSPVQLLGGLVVFAAVAAVVSRPPELVAENRADLVSAHD